MKKQYWIKMIKLNAAIVIINIVAFSDRLIGLTIQSDDVLKTACSLTLIIMSILAFAYGNYKLIHEMYKNEIYVVSEYDEPKDYILALNSCREKKAFQLDIDIMVNQIRQLERKQNAIEDVFFQKHKKELTDSYAMKQVVIDTSNLVYENMKRIINRITIFDEMEYERLQNITNHTNTTREKCKLYEEHIRYVKQLVDENEMILLEFEQLLVEISKMGEEEDNTDSLNTIRDMIQAMRRLSNHKDEISDLEDKYKE